MTTTWAACATALPGPAAVLRLSGGSAWDIAQRAGLVVPTPGNAVRSDWRLGGASQLGGAWQLGEASLGCPVVVWTAQAPRSFTGENTVEILLPGSRDLVELALLTLHAKGASPAPPGGFVRQALANGKLDLDQAAAVLALVTASDADSAQRALIRLRGDLGADLAAVRDELTELRARVEAGLDFAEEDGVAGADHRLIRSAAQRLGARLARWQAAADAAEGPPVVCLVGPANAGKSALFQRLTGAPALVSPVPGTTRDPLEAPWKIGGRTVTLVDTAGWLDRASSGLDGSSSGLDAAAIAAGRRWIEHAALVLACSAPDARLPAVDGTWQIIAAIVATKADLGAPDPRAVVAVSVETGAGLDQLAGLVSERLAHSSGGEPRQQRLLGATLAGLGKLADQPPPDELLAEDLRRITELLSDLIGSTTPDDVLDALFSRFCIGK